MRKKWGFPKIDGGFPMVEHGAGAHGLADLRPADDWCAGFQWIRAWDPGEMLPVAGALVPGLGTTTLW